MKKILPGMELENIHAVCRDATVPDEAWKEKADIVLADLPCSGLGVFGKKPDLKYRVKEEDLKELAGLQRKILENAQAMVKKGGTLLYSTCTIDPMENEENVHWFLKKVPAVFSEQYQREALPATGRVGRRGRMHPVTSGYTLQ